MPDDMGVTGNAVLLLGFIGGSIDKEGGYPGYKTLEITPDVGSLVIESQASGNTYRVSVVQIGGSE